MKTTSELSVISWNVNSLKKRFVDVQQYALEKDIDVICLQETLIDDSYNPRFAGYRRYILQHDENNRGLAVYIKNNIPAYPLAVDFGDKIENIGIKVNLDYYSLNIVNVYVPKGDLDTNKFPDFIYEEPTLLVGT